MLNLLIIGLLVGQTTLLYSQSWTAAERFSSPSNSLLTSTSTALGSDGSMYVVGNFQNMVCFDTIILNASVPNRTRGYLLKLDAQMQPVWAKQFPEFPYDLTLDAQDNVFIAGSRWNAAGSDDTLTYVAKHNSDGTLLASFYSTGTSKNWAKVVRTDAAGNCYVAGERFSAGVATIGSINLPGGNGRQCFIVKFSPDLAQVNWVTITGSSPNLDNVYDLEIDKVNGFVYASGNYSQTCSPFSGCLFNIYDGSFFVEKHSTNTGASLWKKVFDGGSGTETKQFARLAPDGQTLAVAGCFKKTTQFSPTISLTANAGNDDYHVYVSQISANNASVQWAKKISLSGDAFLWRMARSGNELWLNGYYTKSMNVPPFMLTNNGSDAFFFKLLAEDGTVVEAEKQNGNSNDYGYGLAQRDSIVAICGGSNSATLTIGAGAFVLPGNASSAFVARKGGLPQLPPIAGFEASVTSGCVPLAVQFTHSSYQSPTTFNWQFPGGIPGSSTAKNPSVSYSTPGTYNVTLRVSNGGGADTLVQVGYITVLANNPTSVFSHTSNGLTVSFSNTSSNAMYVWDFGDGQSSTSQNPVHNYADCGTYTVTLTSSSACGTASSVSSLTLGSGVPTAIFSSTSNALVVTFSNTSQDADSYQWDFGDGQTSSLENPVHTYANCGTYLVTLTSTNICGTTSSTFTLTLGNGLPTAVFSSSQNGLTVSFSNTSSNATYVWDFGDGQTSNEEDPIHTYAACGTYTVTLSSTNLCGTASSVSSLTLGSGVPTAIFSSTSNGLVVTFSNTSQDADSYQWDFGDGQASSLENPVHTYANCGTYLVTLTSTNICGTTSSTFTLTFGNGLPTSVFSSSPNGLTVSFFNTSSEAMYVWDFGDGQTSNEESPTHQYAACGVYTVTLTSTNACGTASSTATVLVTDFPDAVFNIIVNGLEVSLLNTSTGGISYFWDFGDGNTSTVQNPAPHVYADSGTYVITLVVSNNCGATIFEQTVTTTKTVGTEMPEWLEYFSVFPNPAKDAFNVALKGRAADRVEFVLCASGGQEIFRKQIDFQLGTLTQHFETADLPAGVYLLRVRVGGQLRFAQVVIQR